jgi:PiT family inorganic phosphate transporter
VIALALYTHGNIDEFYIPTWVKIAAGLTIAAGTYVGGWRIIRTLGQRIYKMSPEHGFAAQIAAGSTLYVGTHFGFPISTTQVVTGSVMGAGAVRRFSAIRWGVAGNIVSAWLLTLPMAGLVAAALYYPVSWIF